MAIHIRVALSDVRVETRTVGEDVHIDISPADGEESAMETTPGGLAPLIQAGRLEAGETLYWSRPRLGVRHTATVLANGWLQFEGKPYRTPSGAAVAATGGSQADGWTAWRRERDKVIIGSLR
ncbi:hypothetical protein [Streptomyces sp. NPDC048057]|uniref:restriction system modified-DNA reader domain-containing protein n=1 Tax=Streptomyces sp. NPDC048057 TaxID=3155628 RepID=UPI0033DD9A52